MELDHWTKLDLTFFLVLSHSKGLKTQPVFQIHIYFVRSVLNLLRLTFIGCSGSNCSTFYVYRATSVGSSTRPSLWACIGIEVVWFVYGIVRTLQFIYR